MLELLSTEDKEITETCRKARIPRKDKLIQPQSLINHIS